MVSTIDKIKIYPKKDGSIGCQVATHFPNDPDEFPVVAYVAPQDRASFSALDADGQRDYFLARVSLGMSVDFRFWQDSHSWSCML